jgi:hypothetical protein
MEKVSRRLSVTIRLDIPDIEKLEALAAKEYVRPAKKAENIVLEYLKLHPVPEEQA